MPQPWILRTGLILNAATLEAARPILLFSDWRKAARLKRNASVYSFAMTFQLH